MTPVYGLTVTFSDLVVCSAQRPDQAGRLPVHRGPGRHRIDDRQHLPERVTGIEVKPGDQGIDVSNWQSSIDYAQVAEAGYHFAYILVSDGTTFENGHAVAQARGFQQVGIATGGYLFFRPDDNFNKQLVNFVNYYTAIGGWSLPVMIDCETESAYGFAYTASQLGLLRSNLKKALGTEVGVYVNLNFYDNMAGCPWGWPLWLADPSHPNAPSHPCLLQQTGTGNVPGISGQVDLDVWRGGSTPPPPPPPREGDEMMDSDRRRLTGGIVRPRGGHTRGGQYLGDPPATAGQAGPAPATDGLEIIDVTARPAPSVSHPPPGYWIGRAA